MSFARHGETMSFPFRSQRLWSENGAWYFHTREGRMAGPFKYATEAKMALSVFLAQNLNALPEHQRVERRELAGVQDGIQCLIEELEQFFFFQSGTSEAAALAWARKRIENLENDWDVEAQRERIEVLSYVMDQAAQSAYR